MIDLSHLGQKLGFGSVFSQSGVGSRGSQIRLPGSIGRSGSRGRDRLDIAAFRNKVARQGGGKAGIKKRLSTQLSADALFSVSKQIATLDPHKVTNSTVSQVETMMNTALQELDNLISNHDADNMLGIQQDALDLKARIEAIKDSGSPTTQLNDTDLGILLDDVNTQVTALAAQIEPSSGDPLPEMPDHIELLNGSHEFNNSSSDWVEVGHDESHMLDSGTLSFSFEADTLSGRDGIISKDSSGYDTGGHFTVLRDGNQLSVRIQSTDETYTIQTTIEANREYDVDISFGEGGLKLYLDGELKASNSYEGGLGTTSGGSGNENPWAIGANAWGTGNNNNSGVQDYFDGTISDVKLYTERVPEQLITGEAPAPSIGEMFEDYGAVHYGYDTDFDGNDYHEIGHDDALMLDNGTVELRFNADTTSGRQAIFSKDSSGYDDGGHFTAYIEDGKFKVRLQSDDQSYFVETDVTANEVHDVAISFGDDGLKLYMDGELKDTNSYTGGLGSTSGGSGNENPIAIGANSWVSGDNVNSNLQDYFSGSITDVVIHNTALDASTISDRVGEDLSIDIVEEGGGGNLSAEGAVGEIYNSLLQISARATADGDKQELANETYQRITNVLGQIDLVSQDDENYAAIQGIRDDLVSLQSTMDPYVGKSTTSEEKYAQLVSLRSEILTTARNAADAKEQEQVIVNYAPSVETKTVEPQTLTVSAEEQGSSLLEALSSQPGFSMRYLAADEQGANHVAVMDHSVVLNTIANLAQATDAFQRSENSRGGRRSVSPFEIGDA